MWTTPDGYVLRLSQSGISKIIARLPDSGLREVIESHHCPNLEDGLVRTIGQLVKSARRCGDAFHSPSHKKYPIFTVQARAGKYQILTRPLTVRQNAILFIHFEPRPDASEPGNGTLAPKNFWEIRFHPNVEKSPEVLLKESRKIYLRANPHSQGKVKIWHRIPLEWRKLFPKNDPNRLSNLFGIHTLEQLRYLKKIWNVFKRQYRHLNRLPTAKEVLQFGLKTDKILVQTGK